MLKGNKVALTELRREDSDTLFEWINNPETVRFNAPYAPVHEPSHAAWLDTVARDPTRIVFGIRDLQFSQLIGVLQLVDLQPIHHSAQLIIRIGNESDRNQGAGTEAVKLAVDFAFQDRNIQRVWLTVFADNERAIRAYEKAGFKVEGTMRKAFFIGSTWRDAVMMAALAEAG